jgi:hypothetical protein
MAKFASKLILTLLFVCTLAACIVPPTSEPTRLPAATQQPPLPTILSPGPASLYLAPGVPDALLKAAGGLDLPIESRPESASLLLQMDDPTNPSTFVFKTDWIYAAVAAFPTTVDEVSEGDIRAAWQASSSGSLSGWSLYLSATTAAAFTELWGEPANGVLQIVPADEMVTSLWSNRPAWGIVPFESLEPKLKVLAVNGQSPIRNDFDRSQYPLTIRYTLYSAGRDGAAPEISLPKSNRDEARMTTIILSGVTALVRATAYTMETKGVTYPARDIRDFMRAADITHISNEIPFYTGCDFPNPSRSKLVFCSDPKYIALLKDVGTDVVELTGNHFADYGPGAMLETLDIYNQNGIPYYGGGADLEDALKPLLLEHNGNKIAFLGCNPVDWGKPPIATEFKPGAAPCNPDYLENTIKDLKAQGYLIIVTFQHQEYYTPEARPDQLQDFRHVADAGASIVSGSQAHFAQMMEFYDSAFIHYGLGNLFFDQMGDIPYYPGIRREFIDRYLIYDGKLISVELLTMMLEDYSRPRPMTAAERTDFLNEYFYQSNWNPLVPESLPIPTLTLTPMSLPQPFMTLEPAP